MNLIEQVYDAFLSSEGVCTDTRSIYTGCFYVALKGPAFDGNSFVGQALGSGALYALSDDPENGQYDNCFIVDDALLMLQSLAQHHRRRLGIPVIGVTGTNGKTTTKELLCAVLAEKLRVAATKGNLNNHIGVPLTLLDIGSSAEIAIVEMGANHVDEIAQLCQIAEPDFGIITNIGKAHLEGFGSYENIIKTKNALYEYVGGRDGLLFLNADDSLLVNLSQSFRRKTYGVANSDFVYSLVSDGFTVGIHVDGVDIQSQLFGLYNVHNIAVACLVGLHFGLTKDEIKRGIEYYMPSNNRSQTVKTSTNTLLLDAYNANPSSMDAAIRNFAEIELPHKVLILGEMFELGDNANVEHVKIVQLCSELHLDEVYFVGKWPNGVVSYLDVDALKDYIENNSITNSTILIKGSRGVKLEKLVEVL